MNKEARRLYIGGMVVASAFSATPGASLRAKSTRLARGAFRLGYKACLEVTFYLCEVVTSDLDPTELSFASLGPYAPLAASQ